MISSQQRDKVIYRIERVLAEADIMHQKAVVAMKDFKKKDIEAHIEKLKEQLGNVVALLEEVDG